MNHPIVQRCRTPRASVALADLHRIASFSVLAVFLSGCATMGHDFNSTQTDWIRTGETDKTTLQAKLGDPFRVGIDAGDLTWTYGYYKYSLFGQSITKDLVIRFDESGKVKSFTLNTSFPEEKPVLDPALKK